MGEGYREGQKTQLILTERVNGVFGSVVGCKTAGPTGPPVARWILEVEQTTEIHCDIVAINCLSFVGLSVRTRRVYALENDVQTQSVLTIREMDEEYFLDRRGLVERVQEGY